MNRRNFLKLTLTAGALAATPIALAKALGTKLPVIYSDGEHDDTEGVQAALDGKDFVIESDDCQIRVETDSVWISRGNFKITRSIYLRNESPVRIHGCQFLFAQSAEEELPFFHLETGGHYIGYCTFIRQAPQRFISFALQDPQYTWRDAWSRPVEFPIPDYCDKETFERIVNTDPKSFM